MPNDKIYAYVGANTTSERFGTAKGISVYEIAPDTGDWELIFETEDINPGFLAFNHDKTRLYCTHANHTEVSAYAINADGTLALINRKPLGGYNGGHLCLSRDGKFVLTVASHPGAISVFPILSDGSLGCIRETMVAKGELGPLRATEHPNPMPHQVTTDPLGRYIFSPDRGEDSVHTFQLDESTGKLEQISDMPTRASRTPRHMCFLTSADKAYVLTEFSATIVCCDFDRETGKLTPFQIIPALPAEYTGLYNKGAEIAVHPSEQFLYTSNRGHNSIATYAIDRVTGKLHPLGWQNTYGKVPRFFMIEPGGKYMYVANERSSSIVSFSIREDGRLVPTGQVIPSPSPTCILLTGAVSHIQERESNLVEEFGDYKVFSYPQK